MPGLILAPSSALDLTLEGSVGTFRIGVPAAGGQKSLTVRYLETHIGFDPAVASNDAMLKHLQPVREIFPFNTLNFDELMQRDIDDARVSTELIPYLLDGHASGTIKFFPPIVIVVVPVQDVTNEPAERFPAVTQAPEHRPQQGYTFQVIRSGATGQEAFQFEYPIVDGQPRVHDLARLKLSTQRTRLVIIDGQHRAMALIALHRNLKDDWSDAKRRPFQDYYSEWTKSRIQAFDLKELQLPIVVCTFPELDTGSAGDFNVIKAARQMFLTLNKTARKVTESRNILLNDRDIVSYFLRDTLGNVKARDLNSPAFRIWNIELDQYFDRTRIDSPMACTGVSHIYYMLEHMMLADGDVTGARARAGKFWRRSDLQPTLIRRLDGENVLGAEVAASVRRADYSEPVARDLAVKFQEKYGHFVVDAFTQFRPFDFHARAALDRKVALGSHANLQVPAILFEGQNIGRTFEDYLRHMQSREAEAKRAHQTLPPEVTSTLTQLNATGKAVEEAANAFRLKRCEYYFAEVDKPVSLKNSTGDLSPRLVKYLDKLYDNVFTSVAFQAALVCGFFHVMEQAERKLANLGLPVPAREQAFKQYMEMLSRFFVPQSVSEVKRLLRVFLDDVQGGSVDDWKVTPSATSFSHVVYRGEMKPDEWPKYRYLLLELWRSNELAEVLEAERELCRGQIFKAQIERVVKERSLKERKSEQDFEPADWKLVFDEAFSAFDGFLENLGLVKELRWTEAQAKGVMDAADQEPAAEEDP